MTIAANLALAENIPDPFPSVASLRAAHRELLQRHREEGDTPEFRTEAITFILRGRATGALLDCEDDRSASQSLLDYWSTILYRSQMEPPDATLDEFDALLAPELDDKLCPYLGLDAFRPEKHELYFGRERLIEHLLTVLEGSRLLAVVGSSGSGKSSLVLGGLLPKLKAGAAEDSQSWRYYPAMVPGSNPLANLARLTQPSNVNTTEWNGLQIDAFHRGSTHLRQLVGVSGDALLVIDQFEEIFTLCHDADVRRAFIHNILDLIRVPGARHTIVLTMRTDFESRVALIPELQSVFEKAQVRITPMSAGELREAIEKPAERVGLKFEKGVVDALVNDVLGEPAALPLLQFTLLKLWENRERNRVTWDIYRRVGGGRLALARSADLFYEHLIKEDKDAAKLILLRLVRPGEGLEVTSNRVRRTTLYQTGLAEDRISRVLAKLIDARLVRLTEGDTQADDQIEVAHEALIRNWPRLVGWLEDEREILRQRHRLTDAAEFWLAHGKNEGDLLGISLLAEAQRLEDLNELEKAFVQASLESTERAQREKESARLHELEQAKALAVEQKQRAEAERQRAEQAQQRMEEQARASRRLRHSVVALAVMFVVSTVALGFVRKYDSDNYELRMKLALLEDAKKLLLENKVKEAVAKYDRVFALDPNMLSADNWNDLCWTGSLRGNAQAVMNACEKAVALAPTDANIMDSRGLARAMTGNIKGAIEDFQAYVDTNPKSPPGEQRQRWIEALRTGQNPFSPELLKTLDN